MWLLLPALLLGCSQDDCPVNHVRAEDGSCVRESTDDTSGWEDPDGCEATDRTVCHEGGVWTIDSCGNLDAFQYACEEVCSDGVPNSTCVDVGFRCETLDTTCEAGEEPEVDVTFTCEVWNNGPTPLTLADLALSVTEKDDAASVHVFLYDEFFAGARLPPGAWTPLDTVFEIRLCAPIDGRLELTGDLDVTFDGGDEFLTRDAQEVPRIQESAFACTDTWAC